MSRIQGKFSGHFTGRKKSIELPLRRLNVTATRALAEAMNEHGGRVLYISTDYVFDGAAPPYKWDDKPNPVNAYGQLKLEGEECVLKACEENVVLRVPVLYGPVEYLGESAVTTLLQG